MHKKRNDMTDLYYDIHIVEALKELPVPLITFDGHQVLFDMDKRDETIFEHIANKSHRLHVVDINRIPEILKDPSSIREDRNGDGFRCYVGLRGKTIDSPLYLKITTRLTGEKKESVITMYLVKNS